MESFLDLARRGKISIRRYIIGILLILFFMYGLGVLVPIAVAFLFGLPMDPNTFEIININPLVYFLYIMCPFITGILGIFITTRYIHKRSFLSLITPKKSIKWKPIVYGFGLFFLLLSISSLFEYIINPTDFKLNLNVYQFALFLPFILLLVPLQTTTEELLYRGYILQGTGLVTRNFLILAVVNGFLFMLPHMGNPEITGGLMMVYYALVGFFLAFITLKSGTLELAIGTHAANNLYESLIMNYGNSSFNTPAIFHKTAMDPTYTFLSMVVIMVIYYIMVFRIKPIQN